MIRVARTRKKVDIFGLGLQLFPKKVQIPQNGKLKQNEHFVLNRKIEIATKTFCSFFACEIFLMAMAIFFIASGKKHFVLATK